MIKFNKPYFTGKEADYIKDAILNKRKISGNGFYTHLCQQFFEQRYGFTKTLLTTSCTDALEMAAILIDIQPGDEVIIPSYTFVSSANAFVLRGAGIVFCDSYTDNPNMDPDLLENLVSSKTKAIVVVHYAGVACDMDKIMEIADRHGLYVIEDAAQAIDSYYKDRALGGIGHLGAFSFHETKNIISGEGGLLVVNDETLKERAEIIWEKGTNRSAFFRGEVDKYNWVEIGSSFLPSDMIAAFLWAQLENIDHIQKRRKEIWEIYYRELSGLADDKISLQYIPGYATNNAHMFYILCDNAEERDDLIAFLNKKDIYPVFHYISLHTSPFILKQQGSQEGLRHSTKFSDCLLRLPFYFELNHDDQYRVIREIKQFFL